MKYYSQLTKLASQFAPVMANKDYVTSQLAKKASDLALAHPEDSTASGIARVLGSMQKRQELISKQELTYLYEKFQTQNNKFASAFKTELGIKDQSDLLAEAAAKAEKTKKEISEKEKAPAPYKPNNLLVSALERMLDGKKEYAGYTKKQEANAISCVEACFAEVIPDTKFKAFVDAGNKDIIVTRVEFNTPKGKSFLYVPVEVLENSECICLNQFVDSEGVQDLTKKTLLSAIKKSVGKPAKYTGKLILSAITSKSQAKDKKVSSIEMFFIDKKAKAETPSYYSTDTYLDKSGRSFFPKERFLPVPKFAEQDTFAEKLSSKSGQAEYKFGKQKILEAQKAIHHELTVIGQHPYSIKIDQHDAKGITFDVALASKAAIKMVAKIADQVELEPYFIFDNTKYAFSNDSFDHVAAIGMDSTAQAIHSPMYAETAEQVMQIIASATRNGELDIAEDGLNVIREKYPELYVAATHTFKNALVPDKAPKCKKIIRNASSIHPICSHTNLPVHKTYVDENGACRPLYRRSQGK